VDQAVVALVLAPVVQVQLAPEQVVLVQAQVLVLAQAQEQVVLVQELDQVLEVEPQQVEQPADLAQELQLLLHNKQFKQLNIKKPAHLRRLFYV
jgi:chemotaxis signal transduction protein